MSEALDALVIRLTAEATATEYWWLEQQAPARQLNSAQAASLSQHTPALVLLDASLVRLDTFNLPPGVKLAEVGFVLEEQLCEPLEAISWHLISKQGRQVTLASMNKNLATRWQEQLDQAGIQVARWIPEHLCWQQLWPQPEPVLLFGEEDLWLWQSASSSLLHLPARLAQEPQLQPLLANALTKNLNSLPQQALVPWLASALPDKINLWPQSFFSHWLKKLPLRSVQVWVERLAELGPRQWLLASPWLLILVLLASQYTVTWLAQPSKPSLPTSNAVAQELHYLNQRLDNLSQHLEWQEERLAAWHKLQQFLTQATHLQLGLLAANAQGLRAEIHNLQVEDQAALQQLGGKWQFDLAQQLAIWELPL